MADPADGDDEEDWIEIHNPTSLCLNLTGYTLTDNLGAPTKWTFPANTTILAGGYLIVWADNEPEQNGQTDDVHTNFQLDADGDSIGLFAPNGAEVDSLTFDSVAENHSQGRCPNGDTQNVTDFGNPTPRLSNAPSCP